MSDNVKIPEAPKKTPRCPLCYADFDRRFDPERQLKLKEMLDEAIAKYKEAASARHKKGVKRARKWCETLEASIKGGAAEVFLCHFCKIGIGANDPMVNRWDEVYAQGEKILCPACDHEMRYFCTSTGFMLAQCPVKTCRSRMQLSSPDRPAATLDAPQEKLYDAQGNEIALPNIDRPIATPEAPAVGQVGGTGKDEALPDVTTIPVEGKA